MVTFSVIIATRNRPSQFCEALRSVLKQACDDVEIIVVDDGSNEEHLPEYRAVIETANRPVQFHSLVRRPNGHGQSYAVNFGAAEAKADYLCFLDDDDVWTDADYLSRVRVAIAQRADVPDLIFSNQAAFLDNQRKEGPIWLEGLTA